MIVTEQQAADFIDGYALVMVEIFGAASHESEMTLLDVLARGRAKYLLWSCFAVDGQLEV